MTLLLSSERSLAAPFTTSPITTMQAWFVNTRQKRKQKHALLTLLAMEDHRLNDLGLTRATILDALNNGTRLRRASF